MEVRSILKISLLSLTLMGCQADQTTSKHIEDQKDAKPHVESPKLNRLLDNYFDDSLRLSPVNATLVGVSIYNDEFSPPISDENRAQMLALQQQ